MSLVLSGDGSVGPLSATEIDYLDGVTSDVQTQINAKFTTPGVWTSWTPTITSGTGTLTSTSITSASYTQIGKTVICRFQFKITSLGTGGGSIQFTLPVTAVSTNAGSGVAREAANTGKVVMLVNDTTSRVFGNYYDNTAPVAANNEFIGTFIYEAA